VGTGTFTVTPNQGQHPNATGLPANRIGRWWQLDNVGVTQANITFAYQQSDITSGIEADYKAFRINGGIASNAGGTIDTINNTISVNNVTQFSPWTLAEAVFTAAGVELSGRVLTADGRGIRNAIVVLDDGGPVAARIVRTSSFGYFAFTDVAVGRTYIITVNSKRYQFQPRTVSVTDSIHELNLIALP